MKEDGILVFSTLDIGSPCARILGRRWPWLMKMHIYYFDRDSIERLLKKAGLRLIEFKRYKHTVSMDYLLYKLKDVNRFLYALTKAFTRNRNGFVTIWLGYFVEVYAGKDIRNEQHA